MEDFIESFIQWAWARHHNVLSWYIRPLFLMPFCWFAFKKSWLGIIVTMIALLTSMFWFPEPAEVSEPVRVMLQAEVDYLTGTWTWYKILFALMVPITFTLLGYAFWQRSFSVGLLTIAFMTLSKVAWTFYFAPFDGAMAHLVPALLGLGLVKVFILYRWKGQILNKVKSF